MISLYIHIPFCNQKCKYCSFFVMPEDGETLKRENVELIKEQYLEQLLAELDQRRAKLTPEQQELRTIYIGGGTPFQLGTTRLYTLIDHILDTREVSFLEELSIELNPDPFDEVIDFVRDSGKKYKNVSRMRYSFGIQSLDDKVLSSSGRNYVYLNLINFLREIADVKMHHMVYNLDFIAFGDLNGSPSIPLSKGEAETSPLPQRGTEGEKFLPRGKYQREFFEKVAKSLMFDGVSLYSLELFPGCDRYYEAKDPLKAISQVHTDDGDRTKWDEFQYIKKVLVDAGMSRYEISNFSLSAKRSIHNNVYWNMHSYLGIGINASGMLGPDYISTLTDTPGQGVRYKNTTGWKKYLGGEYLDEESLQLLDQTERDIESCLLGLRTDRGIYIEKYRHILVDNADEVIEQMLHDRYAKITEDGRLILKSKGMDVYNAVLMELMKEV